MAALLFVTIFLIPSLSFAPQTSAPQVRVQSPALATEDLVEFVGAWPYGPCQAAAIDAARKIAVIGNGETLQVLDISTPSSPSKIGEVWLPGNPQGIALAGNYAYVVTLSYLVVMDLSDAKNPSVVTGLFYDKCHFQAIAFSAGRIYLAYDNGFLIYDVSNPRQPVYRATYGSFGYKVVDIAIWGTYALCAHDYWKYPEHPVASYGLDVVDVSSPTAPVFAGAFDLGTDYVPKNIGLSATGYAYVCQSTQGNNAGRLTVVDVAADPAHPAEVGRYERSDNGMAGVALAANYAYLLLNWPRRLAVLNVFNPRSPLLLGEVEVKDLGKMVISGNLLGNAEAGRGFSLYSLTNPVQPVRLANYDTPDTTTKGANGIVARGDYVYMACFSDGLRIIDVSVPSDPREASVCNYRSVRAKVVVSGKYAYGLDGDRLSTYDISSPRSPSRLADLALPCPAPATNTYGYSGLAVRGSYAYVSGGRDYQGTESRAILGVVDISDPFAPRFVGSYTCAQNTRHFGCPAVSGNYVYLGVEDFSLGAQDRRAGLRVIDVSDPRSPREVFSSFYGLTLSYGWNVVVRGNYAYFTGDMLRIYDISNPAFPTLLVSYVLGCDGIVLSGDYAYLDSDKLWIIDISDIYHPTGVFVRGEWANGVAASGNIAYVSGSLSVFKNKMAPDVAITSPSELETLLGSIPIDVRTAHSSGINRVEFYIDESLKASDTNAPYSYTWDTRPYDDGLHTIRVRAYNANGKSADVEREVFTRLVYPPLDLKGEKVLNRSLSQAEYVNALTWRANPNNANIAKYRLYQVEGRNQSLLVEVNGETLKYWHRNVEKDKSYTYALIAVNNAGRESDPVSVTVK